MASAVAPRAERPAGGPSEHAAPTGSSSAPYPPPPSAAASSQPPPAKKIPISSAQASQAAIHALTRECKTVRKMRARGELPVGIDVAPRADDLFDWVACLHGPPGSPYEGGQWNLSITFPSDYPMAPPKIRFQTPIHHPNVNPDGRICLDVTGGHTGRDFSKAWSAALTIDKVLLQIVAMMADPNFDDPWHPMTPEEWRKKAPEKTRENAMSEDSIVPQLDKDEVIRQASPERKMTALDYTDLCDDDDDEEMDGDGDDDEDCCSDEGKASPRQRVFDDEIAQLRNLGIEGDDEHLRQTLVRCRGSVTDAFARLSE